tara:strand:+ start:34 stop:1122 length:1089 start_codon:yes stop_codon:yes gene_type:complete
MIRFIFLFTFLFTFSCKKKYYLNNDIFNTNYSVIELNNYNYILNDTLVVPYGKKLIIKNNIELSVNKKNSLIINNGSLVIGENIDSLNLSFYKNKSIFFDGVKIISKIENSDFNIINNSILKINNAFLKNILINSNSGDFIINNSIIEDCFLSILKNKLVIKNSIINNNLKTFLIDSCNNFILNNCIVFNSESLFFFKNNKSIKFLNNIFLENNNSIKFSNDNLNFSFFNNLVIKNYNFINSISNDNLNYYLINNTFDNNNIILNINNNINYNKSILSKNNIFYNNINLFQLNNININNNYCISNNLKLNGYYNLLDDPLFTDIDNFNYNLNNNSPALGLGVNNINTGANINNIYIIKYLKY